MENQNAISTFAPSVSPWSSPPWLANWRAEFPLPVNSAEVAAALRNVESALIPAAPAMVAMLITQTMQLYGTPANWAAIADFYLEAFEDVPQDLVGVAMKRCRRECKFMPRPAELRDLIASELSERRLALARLRHAQWRSEHPVG